MGLYLLITAGILAILPVMPAGTFAQTAAETITDIGNPTKLPSFETGGHSNAAVEEGVSGITSALLYILDLFKYIMGTIAVIVLIAAGIRLITAVKSIDEIAPQQKENIKYVAIGLIIVFSADALVRQVIFGQSGETLRSQADAQLAAERGVDQLKGLYSLSLLLVGAFAILMIIITAVRMIASGGNEEAITKGKKQVMWAVVGLIIISLAELVVKGIIFPDAGSTLPDVQEARSLIKDMTNFVSGFIGTVAVAFLMYGGVLYVTSVGNEEGTGKAKKIVTGAVIGILLALAAFAIVNTVISFDPDLDGDGITPSAEELMPAAPL